MSSPVVSTRSWLRPHLSTIVVACLVCATIAFINIPGTRDGLGRKHGWPLTYLHRVEQLPPDPPGTHVDRIRRIPTIWSLTEDVADFRPVFLSANLGVLIGLALVTAAMFEWWRRWHGSLARFSLRTALIAMVACSLFFGWIRHRVSRWHSQRTAVVQLERAGAQIRYESILPEWLRELLNDDIGRPFDDVSSVDLSYTEAADADLQCLDSLPYLRSLDLTSTRVTDAGLEHLGHLRELDWLSFDNTAITDRGLVHLQQMNHLTCLGLEGTQVSGPGLRHLKHLHELEILALRDTPLTDDGLRHLTGLPELWCVYTDGTKITESGASDFEKRSRRHVIVEYDWYADLDDDDGDPFAPVDDDPLR